MAVKKSVESIPHTSGVYRICCRTNGKIYVGSAVGLRRRWDIHRRTLRDRTHHNAHLQHSWNLYGEGNFEFEVLQFVATEGLLQAEQAWLERTDCTHRNIGFNISPLASTQGEKIPMTWHGFRDPSGTPVSIVNLNDFCRRHGLDNTHMVAVANGRIISHRGWTHLSGKRRQPAREYTGFVAPGGAFTLITNLPLSARHAICA